MFCSNYFFFPTELWVFIKWEFSTANTNFQLKLHFHNRSLGASLISPPFPQQFSVSTIKTLQPKDSHIVFIFQICSFKIASKSCEEKLLKKKCQNLFLFIVVKIIARNRKFINSSKYIVMGLPDLLLQGNLPSFRGGFCMAPRHTVPLCFSY